jgi:hypothetical protein
VVFRLRPFEQLKLDESRYVLQAAIAGQPDVLEVTFVPLDEWNRFIAKTLAYLS